MSTPLLLIDELCKLAEQATKDLRLETKAGELRAPMIIPGWLDADEPKAGKPPDDEDKQVPFVLVRLIIGEEAEQTGSADVKFIIMTHSKSGQGWRDPLIIIERLRQAFLKSRPLARKFNLQFPIKYEMPEDLPWPYFVGRMVTSWEIARPILTEFEEGNYGERYP